MALLKFLKGNYSSLSSAAIVEGQILICGDTGEMFVDVAADKRVKIGDYVTVANLDALFAIDAASVPTSRLYYVEGANILARSNGTDWDQINKDTGATSIEVVGEGNAVTAASYDAITRKLTLTKGITFATKAELDTLDTFVGDIPDGYTETNVIAYINKKAEETLASAQGGSSETAASVKAALDTYKSENDPKVQANTEAIEALQEANAEGGAVSNAIIAAQDAADQAQKEVDELETVVSEYKTANDAAVAKKADADNVYTKSEIDGKVSALENADLAINNKIGTVADGETVVGLIEAAQAKADAAYVKPVDGIGSNDLHADVVASLAKADSALQATDIENKADKATTLEGYGITDAYTKDEVDTAVGAKVAQSDYNTKMNELDAEDERLAGLIDTNADNISGISAKVDTLVGEDVNKSVRAIANEELAAQLIPESAAEALNTLEEIAAWIQAHPGDAATMNADIAALKTKVDTGEQTVSAYVAAAIEDLGIGDYATVAALGEAVERITDLEEASATHALKTEVKAVSDALDEYKEAHKDDYNNDAVDAKVKAVQDQIDALGDTYATDAELTAAMEAEVERADGAYAAKVATEAHIDNVDIHVTTDDKAKWNGAQSAAEATAAAALATARTEITAEIATAKGEAIADAEGKIATAKAEAIADAEGKIATAKGEAIADAEGKIAAAKEDLQGKIDTVSGNLNTYKNENDAAVALKADASAVYTKGEIEAMLTWGEF